MAVDLAPLHLTLPHYTLLTWIAIHTLSLKHAIICRIGLLLLGLSLLLSKWYAKRRTNRVWNARHARAWLLSLTDIRLSGIFLTARLLLRNYRTYRSQAKHHRNRNFPKAFHDNSPCKVC